MSDKIKVLTLGDHPLHLSGVAIQTKYMIEGLLDKHPDKYEFVSLGGAKEHQNYQPIAPTDNENDWVIYPVDGFGEPSHIRSVLKSEQPDVLWFMTDPRFYEWLWNMEDEIRPHCPMVYYNIWDNYPYPKFNEAFYSSTDVLVPISKLTEDVNREVSEDSDIYRIPHTFDSKAFRPRANQEIAKLKSQEFWEKMKDKFVFFFNGRNCRRKHTATTIKWFKEFLDEVGHDNACLLMHTQPQDPNGPNLQRVAVDMGMNNGEVIFSTNKIPPDDLAKVYNAVDCTVLLSDAEGWGVPITESLACETPVIATKTGGMQEQVKDGDMEFGRLIEPASKMLVGTQNVPYIYEDRLSKEDVLDAFRDVYSASERERNEWGIAGKKYVRNNYGMNEYIEKWDQVFTDTHEKYGSWPNEKYDKWKIEEL